MKDTELPSATSLFLKNYGGNEIVFNMVPHF
jgi:hypothetical protein